MKRIRRKRILGRIFKTHIQIGVQRTTNKLKTLGKAVIFKKQFTVIEGTINLSNMKLGDVFLIVEDVLYANIWQEYKRTTFSDVQELSIIMLKSPVCAGWRMQVQKLRGKNRKISYKYEYTSNFLSRLLNEPKALANP